MMGEPNRGPVPGGFSSFLPRGFGFPSAMSPLPRGKPKARCVCPLSVRQIEQLSDRLLVRCRKFVLVHLLWSDPAVVVDLLVIDVTAGEPAAVDAKVDVVMRIGVVHVNDALAHVDLDLHLFLELARQGGL